MKIVALWGKGETGKSTTLKTFLLRLLQRYDITTTNYENDKVVTREDLEKELAEENKTLLPANNRVQDYIVKLEIDGVKYGITTHGDDEWHLNYGFGFLKDCDVVFCATRTKGNGVDFVKKEGNELLWVAKTYVSNNLSLLKNPLELVNYTNEKEVDILLKIFKNLL